MSVELAMLSSPLVISTVHVVIPNGVAVPCDIILTILAWSCALDGGPSSTTLSLVGGGAWVRLARYHLQRAHEERTI